MSVVDPSAEGSGVAPESEPLVRPEDLSDIYEGSLDGPLFEAYLEDLQECAQVRSVQVRHGPQERAEEPHIDLDQARMLLVLGQIRAAQIRYEHEGVAWIDTLARTQDAIRLIRTKDPIQPRKPRRSLPVLPTGRA